MSKQHQPGIIVKHRVTNEGHVELHVLGNDDKSGRVARITVFVTWREFEAIHEECYNDREAIAQSRIPGY